MRRKYYGQVSIDGLRDLLVRMKNKHTHAVLEPIGRSPQFGEIFKVYVPRKHYKKLKELTQ